MVSMTQKIYRLNGEFFGFIWQARLYDKNSKYVGWIDDKEVWTTENKYLGEILDEKYVVRYKKIKVLPQCKGECPLPISPSKPLDSTSIKPRSEEDYIDALGDY